MITSSRKKYPVNDYKEICVFNVWNIELKFFYEIYFPDSRFFFCILRCHRNLFVSLYEKKWVNLPYQIVCVEISKKLFTSSDIIFNTIFSCDSVETRVFFVLFFSMEIIIIRLIISLLWGLETFSFMFDYLGNFSFILLSSWLL